MTYLYVRHASFRCVFPAGRIQASVMVGCGFDLIPLRGVNDPNSSEYTSARLELDLLHELKLWLELDSRALIYARARCAEGSASQQGLIIFFIRMCMSRTQGHLRAAFSSFTPFFYSQSLVFSHVTLARCNGGPSWGATWAMAPQQKRKFSTTLVIYRPAAQAH